MERVLEANLQPEREYPPVPLAGLAFIRSPGSQPSSYPFAMGKTGRDPGGVIIKVSMRSIGQMLRGAKDEVGAIQGDFLGEAELKPGL